MKHFIIPAEWHLSATLTVIVQAWVVTTVQKASLNTYPGKDPVIKPKQNQDYWHPVIKLMLTVIHHLSAMKEIQIFKLLILQKNFVIVTEYLKTE